MSPAQQSLSHLRSWTSRPSPYSSSHCRRRLLRTRMRTAPRRCEPRPFLTRVVPPCVVSRCRDRHRGGRLGRFEGSVPRRSSPGDAKCQINKVAPHEAKACPELGSTSVLPIDVIDHPDAPHPALPAATVVLARDGDGGLEVLLIHRGA